VELSRHAEIPDLASSIQFLNKLKKERKKKPIQIQTIYMVMRKLSLLQWPRCEMFGDSNRLAGPAAKRRITAAHH
jgi:hypothetical protein